MLLRAPCTRPEGRQDLSARRTRILDLPFNFVEEPRDANERQRDASIEEQFPAWRASMFFLLLQVYRRFLHGRPQSNVTPVPAEVSEAVEEELEEEWMQQLATFVQERLRPAANIVSVVSMVDSVAEMSRLHPRSLPCPRPRSLPSPPPTAPAMALQS